MIEVCIGPYRSGKTGRLLRELIDYKREHPLDQAMILVPSHRYGRMLQEQFHTLLKERSSNGIFGVEIVTVAQACQQIMKAAGSAAHVLPQDLCLRALSEALARMQSANELTHLKAICELPGTAGALYRLIEEFERAALPPSDVLRAVQSTAADAARHQELARIYQRYWERLEELACLDQKRVALRCRELLVKKQVPGLHLRWLMVDGFDRISPLQAEIIEGLSRHAVQTRIAFDYVLPEQRLQLDPQDDEYSWKDSSYGELRKRFQVKPECIGIPGDGTRPRQFAFSTLDLFAEMQETARRCKEAVCVRGIDPGQILVVARDLDNYACAAKLAFNQAGLPVFIDQASELAGVPWMKTALQLFSLSQDEFPRRTVIDLLRSKYVNTDAFGIKPGDIIRIDKRSREAAVIGSIEQWQAAFPAGEPLNDALIEMLQHLAPPAVLTAGSFCRWIEDTMETVLVNFSHRQPENNRKSAVKTLLPDEAELQALAGWRGALRTLLSEESLFGIKQVSYGHFFNRLQQLLETTNFRPEESSAEHIYICSAEHAPNRRYDEVFLVGAVEGQFPRHSGESGFVSADERGRWAMFGVNLPNPREEVGYEKALFRSLIERARKSFCLSFPQVDLNGDEVIPSFYLSDGTIEIDGAVEKIDASRQAMLQPTAAREAVFGWLWRQPGYNLADTMHKQLEVEDYWRQISPCVYGAFQRHQGELSAAYNGDLRDLVSGGWLSYKLPTAWSASGLNNYGQCPFKFWVSTMLHVEPAEEPETGMDTKMKGSLYHHVLELYYRQLIESTLESQTKAPPSDLTAINEEVLQSALLQSFKEMESDRTFRPGPYWENEKKEIAFRARRFLEFDRQRSVKNPLTKPELLEAKFGLYENSSPPLKCNTAVGEIAIRGIIDRIDIERDADGRACAATVVDYKLGSTPITTDDARAGANMQIPIYALAVEKVIMPGVRVKSGYYLGINGAKSNGSINLEKEAGLLSETTAKIAKMVESVAAGDFSVKPYSSKSCSNCPHGSLCRIADLQQPTEVES
jgi:ATP-dependent helicase/nuclease subunit B